MITSERPKRENSVSAETEISAKFTENSAEISAETLPKYAQKLRENGVLVLKYFFSSQFKHNWKCVLSNVIDF